MKSSKSSFMSRKRRRDGPRMPPGQEFIGRNDLAPDQARLLSIALATAEAEMTMRLLTTGRFQ